MIDTLILHIGAGKTGTSAIQTGLVRHRDVLREAGICYPEHSRDKAARAGRTTSGNGTYIAAFCVPDMRKPDFSETAFKAWLADVLDRAPAGKVLFSNEDLELAATAGLKELAQLLSPRVKQVKIIYYLRSLADQLLSNYRQHVEQAEFFGSFADYLECRGSLYNQALLAYQTVFGRENIEILSYESEKPDLFNGFLKALGIVDADLPPVEQVNRSLTDLEMALLRRLGRAGLKRRTLLRIANLLVRRRGAQRRTYAISKADLAVLADKNQHVIDFVNKHYPNPDRPLRMHSDDIVVRSPLSPFHIARR
jgi:hypothetical protein